MQKRYILLNNKFINENKNTNSAIIIRSKIIDLNKYLFPDQNLVKRYVSDIYNYFNIGERYYNNQFERALLLFRSILDNKTIITISRDLNKTSSLKGLNHGLALDLSSNKYNSKFRHSANSGLQHPEVYLNNYFYNQIKMDAMCVEKMLIMLALLKNENISCGLCCNNSPRDYHMYILAELDGVYHQLHVGNHKHNYSMLPDNNQYNEGYDQNKVWLSQEDTYKFLYLWNGIICSKQAKHSDAVTSFKHILDSFPDFPPALFYLSNTYHKTNDYVSSINAINKAIELYPTYDYYGFRNQAFISLYNVYKDNPGLLQEKKEQLATICSSIIDEADAWNNKVAKPIATEILNDLQNK